MLGHQSEEAYRRSAANTLPNELHHRASRDDTLNEYPDETLPELNPSISHDGAWGERDVGGPVDREAAMQEFAELRLGLSRLTRERSTTSKPFSRPASRASRATSGGRPDGLFKRLSAAVSNAVGDGKQHDQDSEDEGPGDVSSSDRSGDQDFQLEQFMRDGHLEKRNEAGESTKKVGVVFKNLTVKGVSSGATFVRTLPEAILGTFGPDLYRILGNYIPALRFGRKPELRTLLNNFTGVVRHGEIMMVLGRPGSGCSTFLKVIANNRADYAAVDGEVHYGGISAEEVANKYRGEVVYNGEDDVHLPTLTVEQTLKFSLLNKTKKRLRGDMELIITALLKMFAMSHTRHTIVGDAYVRGVSGGERKRVSIQESLATKSSLVCWDNSTRGLDASSALDYARSLRIMTDVSDRTTLTTLYQAGEGIYELMDKVLVIDEGRMLFQGPASKARQYFIDLGFHAPPRQTTPDFLTSLCDPNARQFRPGWKDRCPKTAEDLEKAFLASASYQDVLADVRDYESHLLKTNHADTHAFKESVSSQKSRRVSDESNYTVSFFKQVAACTRREVWLAWGDKQELRTKFFIIVGVAFVVSSLFYDSPLDTSGAFMRGGTTFFSIIFLGWLQMSELMKAVSGRAVVERHKAYAFYRPSAVNFARAIVDFPLLLAQVIIFSLIVYFMTGLDRDPGKFFTYALLIFTTTYCLTALYRMFAALSPTIDDAVRFSGLALNLVVLYCGYVMSKPVMLGQKIWFGWLYYISPIAYSFEAVLSNDFHGREMQCSPAMLVPQGPGIQQQNQGCTLPGGRPGDDTVNGDAYLAQQFQYTRGHLWRNWAVIIAFAVLYLLVSVLATEKLSFVGGGGGALVFKKSSKAKKNLTLGNGPHDEEKGSSRGSSTDDVGHKTPHGPSRKEMGRTIEKSEKVFTWEDVTYTVPTPHGPKRLLNKVSGYVKPGVMVALMGASGAGKTTLLNTLSQRQTVGVLTGDMLVDNKPLGTDFQRSTGFVEQMDLHDESATIREALEFSALLRQSRDIPRDEKLAYVDSIIDLLELEDVQDAIISSLGVEQKKRLTIGVELAAKPSLLLFLDEPTSGLDSQSAMSIVRFLRKLCAAGQAIVCTIHQPSSDLIQEFDKILALNPGGNVFYFGPVGKDGSSVVNYFAARGVECPPGKNVAEFLLETAAKPHKRVDKDGKSRRVVWAEEWKESDEYRQVLSEIDMIKKTRTLATQLSNNQAQPIQHEFAAPIPTQAWLLTKRMFIRQWRDPSYLYGRLFICLIMGIFNGFTYWKISSPHHSHPLSLTQLQNSLFTAFLIIMLPSTVLNAVLPKFFMSRSLWEKREHPSRIYGWVAFCTAEILSEIPGSIVAGTLYFLAWYLPTGLPRGTGSAESESAVYVWLMSVSFMIFIASWGQWICAFAPSFAVITNVLPFFLVIFSLFNGVVVPWQQMNVAWKWWLYYLNPATYWIGGNMAAVLRGQTVHCADNEMAVFRPPVGESCQSFAGTWLSGVGRGYLTTMGVVDDGGYECGYCPYADGEEYLASLNVKTGQMWRNFGIFAAFCVSNWALVYFFIYTVRVKGWSFGFGFVGSVVGAVVGTVKESVEGVFGGKKEKEETKN
ncbi:ABC-2 type transporter-domain-containing protein [Neurospora tetraspora]|uniref:ABC-2 type transporter-domain-containing protein n=1 Tax=Neurospora tetraspora TaxID=94610 RepID=A0AAE0J213_9PEZI|nr:ABC-2 type transporter-domain-containing protein [Neurospora tetraspora]